MNEFMSNLDALPYYTICGVLGLFLCLAIAFPIVYIANKAEEYIWKELHNHEDR